MQNVQRIGRCKRLLFWIAECKSTRSKLAPPWAFEGERKMKIYPSCLTIDGLTAERALEIAKDLPKSFGISARQIVVDHPDPPDLCEKEYEDINRRLDELLGVLQEAPEYGEASGMREVHADVKRLRRTHEKLVIKLSAFAHSISILQTAAESQAKK
jgi:hypothetical protein